MPKLYYSAGSCSAATFIIAHKLGLKSLEVEAVDIQKHLTASGVDFYTINPHGNVPALILDDGTLLNEGAATLFAVANMKPDSGIVAPYGSTEFLQTVNELSFLGTELHSTYGPLFNPTLTPEARAAQTEKLMTKFKRLEAKLAGKEYLVGGKFGLADSYAYICISWHKYVGVSLDAFPNVLAFAARVAALPEVVSAHAWIATVPTHAA